MMNSIPLTCREVEEAMEVAAKVGQLIFSKVHSSTLQILPRKTEQVNLIVDLVLDAAAVYSRSQMLNRERNLRKREQENDVVVILKGGGSHAS